jgi:hypothetical protein
MPAVYMPNNFQRWSDGVALLGNNFWNYSDEVAVIADILVAGFFNAVNENNPTPVIRIEDIMWINCSDFHGFVGVSAVTPNVVLQQFDPVIGPGQIGTAEIANQAVTAAKIANNTITDAQVADNGLASISIAKNVAQYVKVPMTAAQFNGMYAAPFVLVAAAGANTIINVEDVLVEVIYGTAQFAAGGVIAAQYDSTVHGAGTLASATIAAATAQGWAANHAVKVDGALADSATTTTVNKGIYLSNQTGAFTTGDSTFNIHVKYTVDVTTV